MQSEGNSVRARIQKEKVKLSTEGVLELTKMSIPSIDIGVQRALKVLNVSESNIKSFAKLKPQPILREVIACNCPLSDFAGLTEQKVLKKIKMTNTPLSDQPHFRIAAVIAIGQKLSSINDTAVTQKEREIARQYPPITKTLLENGWVLQYPVPSEQDFDEICNSFGIKCTNADKKVTSFESMSKESPKHQKSANGEIEEEGASFAEEVINILSPLGFPIRLGDNMKDDIVNSVDKMLKLLSAAESLDIKEQEIEEPQN